MSKKPSSLPLLLLLVSCVSPLAEAQEHASPKVRLAPDDLDVDERRVVDLYARAFPTVVTILTKRRRGSGPESGQGLGTGVLISPECHILTAAHVVEGAATIMVKTQDKKLRPAELLFSEPRADIALLRLRVPDATLPHAVLGDSDRLAVGQNLYIIGNPRGLENSLSVGHISGFRHFNRLYDGSILVDFIQTDAAINSGNSGGPAFDSKGRVIGLASRILSRSGGSEGLGFVVTINTAKKLLALEGRVWTGMNGVFLSAAQLSVVLNIDRPGGLLLQHVTANSPAAKAGLRHGRFRSKIGSRTILLGGDLILELGGQNACHGECLARAHEKLQGLDRIPVVFLRGGKVMRTTIDVSATRKKFLGARNASLEKRRSDR